MWTESATEGQTILHVENATDVRARALAEEAAFKGNLQQAEPGTFGKRGTAGKVVGLVTGLLLYGGVQGRAMEIVLPIIVVMWIVFIVIVVKKTRVHVAVPTEKPFDLVVSGKGFELRAAGTEPWERALDDLRGFSGNNQLFIDRTDGRREVVPIRLQFGDHRLIAERLDELLRKAKAARQGYR